MNFKDLFSKHANDYKRFRPTYPEPLFEFLSKQTKSHEAVWDCGTGNGQGAKGLSKYFSHVYATDASRNQIEQAEQMENITYRVATAERSGLPTQSVSLVTVFQAVHWFDLDQFYKEVRRVILPQGVLAIIGYNTAITGVESIDKIYREFCFDYLWEKKCWAMERETLNCNYEKLKFPFKEIPAATFNIEMHWNYQDYLSYLNTWSAVKKFIELYGANPIEKFVVPKIKNYWLEKEKPQLVKFPLVLRLGIV